MTVRMSPIFGMRAEICSRRLPSANESADGWQEVTFSTPVAIEAGTTYVASYHTSGHYSATPNYFTGAQTDGHLSTQNAAGVYAYGSGPVFPHDSYNATNYLVDVVFNAPPVTITNLKLESGNGTLVDNHDGTWSYTPAPDDDSEVSFSYIASDGLHLSPRRHASISPVSTTRRY